MLGGLKRQRLGTTKNQIPRTKNQEPRTKNQEEDHHLGEFAQLGPPEHQFVPPQISQWPRPGTGFFSLAFIASCNCCLSCLFSCFSFLFSCSCSCIVKSETTPNTKYQDLLNKTKEQRTKIPQVRPPLTPGNALMRRLIWNLRRSTAMILRLILTTGYSRIT